MKGDKLVLQDYHRRAASEIVSSILGNIKEEEDKVHPHNSRRIRQRKV